MKQKPSSKRRRSSTKSVLRLPDLEHAKAAVLNSLTTAVTVASVTTSSRTTRLMIFPFDYLDGNGV